MRIGEPSALLTKNYQMVPKQNFLRATPSTRNRNVPLVKEEQLLYPLFYLFMFTSQNVDAAAGVWAIAILYRRARRVDAVTHWFGFEDMVFSF